MNSMEYKVTFKVGIHNMEFIFDSIQDAANFANIAAAHGIFKPYSKEPRPVRTTIEIVRKNEAEETEKE